jgi:hypothetical protein
MIDSHAADAALSRSVTPNLTPRGAHSNLATPRMPAHANATMSHGPAGRTESAQGRSRYPTQVPASGDSAHSQQARQPRVSNGLAHSGSSTAKSTTPKKRYYGAYPHQLDSTGSKKGAGQPRSAGSKSSANAQSEKRKSGSERIGSAVATGDPPGGSGGTDGHQSESPDAQVSVSKMPSAIVAERLPGTYPGHYLRAALVDGASSGFRPTSDMPGSPRAVS